MFCLGFFSALLILLIREMGQKLEKRRKSCGLVVFFFFPLPHHFLHFHFDLPLLNLVCLCSVIIGMNVSASGPFVTAFDAVLHSGHFTLVLIKNFSKVTRAKFLVR